MGGSLFLKLLELGRNQIQLSTLSGVVSNSSIWIGFTVPLPWVKLTAYLSSSRVLLDGMEPMLLDRTETPRIKVHNPPGPGRHV